MDLIDYANDVMACTDHGELMAVHERMVSSMGRTSFAISSFTQHGPVIIGGIVPGNWEAYYMEREYWMIDPVFRAQQSRWEPHTWRSLVGPNTSKEARAFMDESADVGMKNGLTVSVPCLGNKVNFVVSSAEHHEEHTRPECLSQVYTMASVFAAKRGMLVQSIASLALSDRERETVELIARSLTNAEIAKVMRISVKTVEENIRRIQYKTGARGKLEIALRAAADPTINIM